MTPPNIPDLIARLTADDRLPFCPYDRRSPEYWAAPDDKPCKVCGTENDSNKPDKCNGAGSRIMAEAASALTALAAERDNHAALIADMTARMDRISNGTLYASLTARAEAAEQRLAEIREIASQDFPNEDEEVGWRYMKRAMARIAAIAGPQQGERHE